MVKKCPVSPDAGLIKRTCWQHFHLSREAEIEGCDLLFVPGGSYTAGFHPVVVVSQNLLPFDLPELSRYGFSLIALRLLFLRIIQSRSFRRSDGVIFLTEYAKDHICRATGRLNGVVSVIPHGLNKRFLLPPRKQADISTYTSTRPYRLLYVSIVDVYKHQWRIVEAIGRLRMSTGWPLELHLVGPSFSPAFFRLTKAIGKWDPNRCWVVYHGSVPYDQLHSIYSQADIGIFALLVKICLISF